MASPEKTGHKPLRSDRDQLKTGGNDKKDTSTIHVTSKDPVYDDITTGNMESDNSRHDVDFLSMESEYSINEDDFQRMISLEAEYDEAPFAFSGAIVNRQNMFSPTSTYRPPPPPPPPPPIGGSQPHYIEQFNDPVEADSQTSTSKRKKMKGKVNDTFKTKLKNKKKTLEYINALDEMRLSLSGVKGKVYDAPKTKLLSTKETSGNSKPLDDEMMLSVPDSKVGRDKSPTVIQRLKGLFKRKNDYEHPSDIHTDTEIPNQTHPPRDISKEFTKREDSTTPEKIDPYSHAKRKDEPFPENTEFRPSRVISKGFTKRENKPTSKNIEPDAHTYTEIGLPKGSSSTETLEDSRPEARDSDSTETHENFRPGAIVSPLVVQAQIEIYRAKYKSMDIEVKRKLYKCGESFLTNEQIPNWMEANAKLLDNSEGSTPNRFAPGEHFKSNALFNQKVALWYGDITRLEIDAIVNTTSSMLMCQPIGVNKAIRAAAGILLDVELKLQWSIVCGSVFATAGYNLPAKWIFHTSGPVDEWQDKVFYLLRCYKNALNLLKDKDLATIAFPCIAAGDKGISAVLSSEVALKTVREWLEENHKYVDKIIFCIFDKEQWDIYNKTMHMVFPTGESTQYVNNVSSIPAEIMRMDSKSVELYKQALEEGKEEDHTIRIMVVGPYGVGKTALTKRLLCQEVDVNERNSTDGIDVHVERCKVSLTTDEWTVDLPDKSVEILKRIVKVLGSSQKQQNDTLPNQESENGSNQNANTSGEDASSGVEEKILNTTEETISHHSDIISNVTGTSDQHIPDLDIDADSNTSCSMNLSSVENEDTLMAELKEVVASSRNTEFQHDYAKISVWDFGGQFVFYSTHQMFLTHRAIYILVCNMSQHIGDLVFDDEPYFDCSGTQSFKIEDQESRVNSYNPNWYSQRSTQPCKYRMINLDTDGFVDNWLTSKHGHLKIKGAGSTPIILVGTHTDHLSPIIKRRTLEQLNSALPVPITSDEELDLFLRFQHEVGTILYFSIPELRDQIVLSPQFLVDALKSLITAEMFCKKKPEILDKWREFRQKGILTMSLLDAVWKQGNQTFHENREHLLNLMEHLNVIARPISFVEKEDSIDSTKIQKQDMYLAPCMLKDPPPHSLLESHNEFISTPCFCLTLGNIAFPSAIFNRLLVCCILQWPIARSGKKYQIYCGCGQFDVDLQHRLTLTFTGKTVQLRITRYSKTDRHPSANLCKSVLAIVKGNLRRICDFLSLEVDLKEFVKCPADRLESSDCLHSVEKLQECQEFPCHHHNDVAVLCSSDLLKYWIEKDAVNSRSCSPYSVLPCQVLYRVPTDRQLAQISKGIGKEFQQLGLSLGLSHAAVDQIRETYHLNVVDQIFHVLLSWRKQRGNLATYGELERTMLDVGVDTLLALADIH